MAPTRTLLSLAVLFLAGCWAQESSSPASPPPQPVSGPPPGVPVRPMPMPAPGGPMAPGGPGVVSPGGPSISVLPAWPMPGGPAGSGPVPVAVPGFPSRPVGPPGGVPPLGGPGMPPNVVQGNSGIVGPMGGPGGFPNGPMGPMPGPNVHIMPAAPVPPMGGGPHGHPMGGPMQVMGKMRIPSWLAQLNLGNRTEFFHIKTDMNLTKGQIVSNLQNWLQTLPQKIQTEYASWQSNVTNWKNEMLDHLKQNVSQGALDLINNIQGAMNDQTITHPQTCERIVTAINSSSPAVVAEIKKSVKEALVGEGGLLQGMMGGPGGPGGPEGMMGPVGGMGGVAGRLVQHMSQMGEEARGMIDHLKQKVMGGETPEGNFRMGHDAPVQGVMVNKVVEHFNSQPNGGPGELGARLQQLRGQVGEIGSPGEIASRLQTMCHMGAAALHDGPGGHLAEWGMHSTDDIVGELDNDLSSEA